MFSHTKKNCCIGVACELIVSQSDINNAIITEHFYASAYS